MCVERLYVSFVLCFSVSSVPSSAWWSSLPPVAPLWHPGAGCCCFFSVLRLCGSRQVVAHCRADERIVQMQVLCPALGSRKWSEDHYAVQSQAGPKKAKPRSNTAKKTRQSKQNQPNNKTRKESPDQTTPMGWQMMPLNYETLHGDKHKSPDHRARSCEGVQQNNPLSSAETQDPPCQDPGDRAEKPSRHKTSSQ